MTFARPGVILAGLAALALGCSSSKSDSCTGGKSRVSGLPLPKGCVAAPAGTAGNLQVLPWAGFKGAVSYTFDDASPSQIQHYAALNRPGIRMTFYVVPSQVERNDPDGQPLLDRWRQVRADGHEIGSHTINHCQTTEDGLTLTSCAFGTPAAGQDTAALQVAAGNDYVKTTLGQADALGNPAVWTMASPYGNANYDSVAQAAGLLAHRDVWTNQPGSFLPAGDVANIHHLPCWAGGGASGGWGVDEEQSTFEKLVNDARGRGRWTVLLFHGVAPNDWDDSACCPVPATAIAGSMEHLKRWGDVWGDTVVNVASYTIAQNLFASLTPTTDGDATTWTWTLPANFPPGKYLRVTVDGGTLTQNVAGADVPLAWNERGFYEVALSAGNLTLTP